MKVKVWIEKHTEFIVFVLALTLLYPFTLDMVRSWSDDGRTVRLEDPAYYEAYSSAANLRMLKRDYLMAKGESEKAATELAMTEALAWMYKHQQIKWGYVIDCLEQGFVPKALFCARFKDLAALLDRRVDRVPREHFYNGIT